MNPNTSAVTPEVLQEERRAKRFTLISVALNLFFVAIAATLPSADAAIMRAAYRDNAAVLDASRAEVDRAVAEIKQSFRAEPYNIEATRKAMADARRNHQRFIELLHEEIATAASKMSPAGRAKLAEYSSARVTIKPDR
jgi:hypothetical protein